MGAVASCRKDSETDLISAIQEGDLQRVKFLLGHKPQLVNSCFSHGALSPLHYAALYGQPDVLLLLLGSGAMVDALNGYKQTPLMLACKNGRLACIERLVEQGANVLMFDAYYERTCLHYAAKSGHLHCLQRILNAARGPAVAETWGYVQFMNVRDGTGATPLHLAARARHAMVVRLLLNNGALVCAATTKSGRSSLGVGSTPLHFAARGGSTECVKELLAWGANRLQRNSQGHTPFFVAMKYHNKACAALLNPLTAEPLVWPSPWKFMSNLDPDTKVLLEMALAKANDAWEKRIFSVGESLEEDGDVETGGLEDEDDDESELCCICFEHECAIEVQGCGHQMCAGCTLALCCHNKPNPSMSTSTTPAPTCPFCRCDIERLRCVPPRAEDHKGRVVVVVEEGEEEEEEDKEVSRLCGSVNQSKKPVENGGSSSNSGNGGFIGLVSKGSFKLLSSTRGSGRVADIECLKESSSEQEMLVQS